MGCFKAVLGKLKKDVQKKMGNMPTLKINDDRFERMSEERSSRKSYSDFLLPDWMEDPRVAMDFTDGTGRIIHDQEEIAQIRREPRNESRLERFEKYESFPKEALEHGLHLTQKYFHGNLSRENAERILLETFNTNGTWLLRESNARTNCLTISYLYEGRVHHKYITAAAYYDPSKRTRIYVATLDHQVAFYDVHTLIEYYRLNKGPTMLCMLTTSVKNPSQRDDSPPRYPVGRTSRPPPVPINLVSSSRDPSNSSPQSNDSGKSSKSLKDMLSKSIQALKPKKLPWSEGSSQVPVQSTTIDKPLAITNVKTKKQEEPSVNSLPLSSQGTSSGISSFEEQTTPETPSTKDDSKPTDSSSSSSKAPKA